MGAIFVGRQSQSGCQRQAKSASYLQIASRHGKKPAMYMLSKYFHPDDDGDIVAREILTSQPSDLTSRVAGL